MAFSFRPGMSYLALAITISIIMTIVFVALTATILKASVDHDPSGNPIQNIARKGLGIMAGMFLIALSVIFVVSSVMLPPLCHWSTKNRSQQQYAPQQYAPQQYAPQQ